MNTLVLNGLFILFSALTAIFIALILNEIRYHTFVKITQSVMLFPYFLSWVIVSYILYAILNQEFGTLNRFLVNLGLKPVRWYSEPKYWRGILVILRVWRQAGYNSIIYLAAITGIDAGIYEAAEIDGAGKSRKIFHITLPLLMPTVMTVMLLGVGRMFYGDFGMFYALIRDNGTLFPVADVIDTYVFRMLRQTGSPSQAMAVGLYQAVMGFVLVFGCNWITRRLYPEGSLF
jgi:putative aldouronate transport system permease protein